MAEETYLQQQQHHRHSARLPQVLSPAGAEDSASAMGEGGVPREVVVGAVCHTTKNELVSFYRTFYLYKFKIGFL